MKAFALIDDDERAVAVTNASCRWALNVLGVGLYLDFFYRDWVYNENAWDLMVLLTLAGMVSLAYQFHHRIFHRQWLKRMGLLIGLVISIQILVAGLMIWYMKYFR